MSTSRPPHRNPINPAVLGTLLVVGGVCGAQEEAKRRAPVAAEAMVQDISFPSPVEYFSALAKSTNPRWRKWYRTLEQQPPTERLKVAAGLGMLVAEAHLSAMARDEQRLRNVCGEVASFAKVLGLSEAAGPHLAAIEDSAGRGAWSEVHLTLEQVLADFAGQLQEQRDDDLARLSQLGLWVRVLHVGSAVVGEGGVGDLALAAGGEGMPQRLAGLGSQLSERVQGAEDVAFMLRQGDKLCRVWAPEKFEAGREFSLEDVTDSHERLGGIIKHLSKR